MIANRVKASGPPDPGQNLGELAAIRLALQSGIKTLLCDDLAARRRAASQGLEVLGTLGVLEAAANEGLLDLRATLAEISAKMERGSVSRSTSPCKSSRCGSQTRAPFPRMRLLQRSLAVLLKTNFRISANLVRELQERAGGNPYRKG